jgi:hypothetical protein
LAPEVGAGRSGGIGAASEEEAAEFGVTEFVVDGHTSGLAQFEGEKDKEEDGGS